MLIYPFLILLTFHMIFIYDKSTQDIIYMASNINNNSLPNEGIYLNQSGHNQLGIVLMINNPTFDNDDNPYGKFIYHMYSNMKNLTDTSTRKEDISIDGFEDRFIPLIICPDD